MHSTRSCFTHSHLLSVVRSAFNLTTENPGTENTLSNTKPQAISDSDCLMSGLAIFSLKYPSLLQFEKAKMDEPFVRHNLGSLYGINHPPCDTYLRERLDDQNFFAPIRRAFVSLFHNLQRSKVLEDWRFIDGKYLISLDASGFFSSKDIKCDYCCTKVTNKGKEDEATLYHHQMLVGAIVSPGVKQVLPIGFEPIIKSDGSKKNDCERSAAKRWLEIFREHHPKLQTIIVADGLYSNAPFIKLLKAKNCSFILSAKEDDHKFMYEYFRAGSGEDICEFEDSYIKPAPATHKQIRMHGKYRFMNNVPLNDSNDDLRVNVLEYKEEDPRTKKVTTWVWVTDIELTKSVAKQIMKGGRARWRIENETFNTLKNQGYNFEHNFGHGNKGLSNVFAGLMLLAFYIDQILEACNLEYQKLRVKYGAKYSMFEKVRNVFCIFMISSFERLYEALITGPPQDRWL